MSDARCQPHTIIYHPPSDSYRCGVCFVWLVEYEQALGRKERIALLEAGLQEETSRETSD